MCNEYRLSVTPENIVVHKRNNRGHSLQHCAAAVVHCLYNKYLSTGRGCPTLTMEEAISLLCFSIYIIFVSGQEFPTD